MRSTAIDPPRRDLHTDHECGSGMRTGSLSARRRARPSTCRNETSNIVIHNKELQKKWKDYVNGSLSMDGARSGHDGDDRGYTGEEWLEQLKDYLDGNFAYIDEYLKYLPKAHLVKAEGTYLA